jgi:hypothetical protein
MDIRRAAKGHRVHGSLPGASEIVLLTIVPFEQHGPGL